jgi:hypothetical protein
MSTTQNTVQQLALALFAKEQAAAKAAAEQAQREAAQVAQELAEAERQARIRAEQEREEARLRAERALAEEVARAEAEALNSAVQAELIRLRNRSPLEILQDEVAELKRQLADLQRPQPSPAVLHTRQDGGLDMRYKSSKIYTLAVVANNSNLGGDPHYGFGKILRVTYSLGSNATPLTKEVNEHQTLTISSAEPICVHAAIWFTNPRASRERREHNAMPWISGFINESV